MIYLGNVRRAGVRYIASRTVKAVLDQGQAAVFIGANGEAAAYSYLSPDYERHTRVHRASLVGVYRSPEACDKIPRVEQQLILSDIEAHVAHLHIVPAADAA